MAGEQAYNIANTIIKMKFFLRDRYEDQESVRLLLATFKEAFTYYNQSMYDEFTTEAKSAASRFKQNEFGLAQQEIDELCEQIEVS